MTIGELYEKLGQLDGEQMQGHIYIHEIDNVFFEIDNASFDGKDVILFYGNEKSI